MTLTKRQAQILAYVRDYIGTHGYAPTIETICEAHGLRSLATVHKHLENLHSKGYITRRFNHARAMTTSGICETCGQTKKP